LAGPTNPLEEVNHFTFSIGSEYMEKRLYIVRHCEAEGQDFLSPLTKRGFK